MTVDAREAMKERAANLAYKLGSDALVEGDHFSAALAEPLILAALLEADREATERERELCARFLETHGTAWSAGGGLVVVPRERDIYLLESADLLAASIRRTS
jgi:hypothetical protein